MQKRVPKHHTERLPVAGLCTTLAVLSGILCLLALLVQKGAMPESVMHPALAAGCLLSGVAGCIVSRSGGGKRLELLLSGAVPAAALLCCGIVGSGEVSGRALWNAAALLIPCLAAQLFRGNKRHKRRR